MSEPDDSKYQGQQSRLDKLFSLLEAPSTAYTIRKLTAKQIASIVETSPEDGGLIIARLAPLILSPSSDVRVCASFGLELISGAMLIEDLDYYQYCHCSSSSPLPSLSDFDLESILNEQLPLLASGGSEFEVDPKLTAKMQRQNLRQVFSIAKGVEVDDELADELVKEEDLTVVASAANDEQTTKSMSARERAMAKRKAKQSLSAPAKKSASSGNGALTFSLCEAEKCALTKTASFFVDNLFCANWYVRHGCLLGIEAIFEGQGGCGPKSSREALCHCLISLLALDRFGDFNGDHMIAPVREAAASVLGLVAKEDLAEQCAAALSTLLAYSHHWQVRHGGLVGLNKLNVNSIQSINELVTLAPQLLDDQDDDVKTLTAKLLCKTLTLSPAQTNIKPIFEATIALLEKADDLSSSVSPVLELLRMLCEREEFKRDKRISVLLRPFFRSPLSSIRMQTLQTISSLDALIDDEINRQCLQVVLLEEDLGIATLAFDFLKAKTSDFRFAKDYLPVLFTDIGQPFPFGIFQFYCLGSPEPTTQPPSHELSFRPADAMVVDPAVACRQRLMTAKVLSGQFSDLSDYTNHDLSNVLITALNPTIKCELVNEKHKRDILFKAVYNQANTLLQTASDYFSDTTDEVEPIVEFAAELVAQRLDNPLDVLLFLSGNFEPSNSLIKICRHLKLDQAAATNLLQRCTTLPLLLLYVFLESDVDVCVDVCVALIKKSAIEDLSVDAPTVFKSLFNKHPQRAIKDLLLPILLPILTSDANDDRRVIILSCIERLVLADDETCSLVAAFAPFLLFPCLSRISDQSERVRSIAAPLFAVLVRLIPLDLKLCEGMQEHQEELEKCRSFIAALSDPSKMLSCVTVPSSVKATLRPYQQTGYSWLVFLQRYGLHGALCDDMGLGKTLQTLACLAYYYEQSDSSATSLIICPSGLVGHWKHEVQTYIPHFTATVYEGKPTERRSKFKQPCHILIVAYDVFRNDLETFMSVNEYGYLILDEGHLIRNTKTKLWSAVKSVKAKHRLILTGTPIQNNVSELWALFDILIPGYLGDQKAFGDSFARPIRAASLANASSLDFQAAQKCLKRLHKQVLPFILRRMKEDVLKDLPPKIIQDYECELSEEQALLYNELVEKKTSDALVDDENNSMQKMVAFRKICIHPAMALEDASVSQAIRQQVVAMAKKNGRASIDDISLSPKLELLKDLIASCGIVAEEDNQVSSRHRMLIFAQQKKALDVVEGMVLRQFGGNLSWLRLDGDVPASQRQSVVQRFNRDPSIGVLLLTTKVGGLGLNLTGADTVVFLEHDWNPMADLQAMDRAHRLGQQRVVSVYRLITKGTIEERIMGLQQWKVRVAKTIVNQQNASMSTMETAGLLDLFVDETK